MSWQNSHEIGIKDLLNDKRVLVIGNAKSLNEKSLKIAIKENDVVCAFNRGVERFKPNIAFLSIADAWNGFINVGDAFTVHVSSMRRPSLTANYTIPIRIIDKLKPLVGYRPSSGCIANAFLSQKSLNIKSLTLIGFDFKLTPTYYDQKGTPADEPHDYMREKRFTIEYFNRKCNFTIL